MKLILRTLFTLIILYICTPLFAQENKMDLSGEWAFQLDVMDFRRSGSLDFRYQHPLQDKIMLPGITDDYKLGLKSDYRHIDRLTREYEYMGPAWYQRYITIPSEWEGKRIHLSLERCHWLSTVYIGTKEAGRVDYISVPHQYDLSEYLTPGEEHSLMICVDNRFQYPTHKWDHAHTEFTQINWNGILGEMTLEAVDPIYVEDIQIYPDITGKTVRVKTHICNHTELPAKGNFHFLISGEDFVLEKTIPIDISEDSASVIEHTILLGNKICLWDEFNPNLYQIDCQLSVNNESGEYRDQAFAQFGMREVKQGKNQILINNNPVHLRGTVENAVFPATGYVPVDDASWERVLNILKSYGMNHMRFHSWCPPAAAFRAADKIGVYLQVELPFWGADAEPNVGRFNFFRREQKAILKEYGNHPSFILYCNGNEITGDFDFIEELTATGRETDDRHLYSGATARKRVPSDQYFTSHVSNKGRITVYEGNPSTDIDRNEESDIDVPVIAHEAGQRCMYPDFNEMVKYTGPVKPRNFEIFKELLTANGMLDQADDFFKASGALTVIEYKDVIETLLRTSTSGGFQLLSINDFPGQGYAFVGILDPFWNSKELISPEKFREFCAPTVPLLRFAKRAYFNDETFEAKAEVYHYGPSDLKKISPKWLIKDQDGKILKSGKLSGSFISNGGVSKLGNFQYDLSKTNNPQKLTVEFCLTNDIKNSWDIWVYPRQQAVMESTEEVLYTHKFDDKAKEHLAKGKKVIFYPNPQEVKGRKSNFHNHFWNPVMFKWPPMTLGCLMQSGHPFFNEFITESHTDWQWWDILNNAKVIEMQDAPDALRPIIQTIDSHDNNRKLGIAFEASVNGGKLLVLALDVEKDMGERPATLQLLKSIDSYVKSDAFNPTVSVDISFINSFIEEEE